MHLEAIQLWSASESLSPPRVCSPVGLSTFADGFFTDGNSMSRFFRVNSVTLQNSLGTCNNNTEQQHNDAETRVGKR